MGATLVVARGRHSVQRPRQCAGRCLVGAAHLGPGSPGLWGRRRTASLIWTALCSQPPRGYEAKDYAEAQKELEPLLARFPNSFEVNELTGLVYAAQGQDDEANRYLENAARFKPKDPTAHTNLAVNLVHLGKDSLAEVEFRKAVELDPESYGANHNLGEFYIRTEQIAAAIAYLEKAQSGSPTSYDNGYDLALAYERTGRLPEARRQVEELLRQKDISELHNLLGGVEEKAGNYVAAVNELEKAAHMDPSESNLFDWGSEPLVHQTLNPAIEVFSQAVKRYPTPILRGSPWASVLPWTHAAATTTPSGPFCGAPTWTLRTLAPTIS